MFELTIRLARSYLDDTSWKNKFAGFALERDVANLVNHHERHPPQPSEFVLQASGVMGSAQPVDPLSRCRERNPMTG